MGTIVQKVTFDTQDSLDDKIDKHTSMMSKLTAQISIKINRLSQRYIKVNREDNQYIIMINVIIKIGIDQIVEKEGHHSEVEVSMDRTTGEDHITIIIIEMTIIIEETILEKCKTTEVKILEEDIEAIIETTTLKEVEVGLGKDSIQVILEGMTEIVIVGLDQVQELVLIETGSDD